MISLSSATLSTPIGQLWIAATPGGMCRISFPNRNDLSCRWFEKQFGGLPREGEAPVLKQAVQQLEEFFQGRRQSFDLPLDLRGTAFQLRIWEELGKIPFGSTVSYGEIACRVGKPKAAQAVGSAVGKNPVPIVVPCHRVLGSDGALVGFGGGLQTKRILLELEQTRVSIDADGPGGSAAGRTLLFQNAEHRLRRY